MAKKKIKFKPVAAVAWLVGILVALSVGFGMTSKVLMIPVIPAILTVTAGWIIVILTIVGAVLTIKDYLM